MSSSSYNISDRNKSFWDETFDFNGSVRSSYNNFLNFFGGLSKKDLKKLNAFSEQFFVNQGVTFTVYNDMRGVERIFPFDIFPRIINEDEWRIIESGIKQRIKALNLFLKDIYNEQFILKDKVFPTSLLISNDNFRREMISLKVPKDIYTHISGVDLIRNNDGKFYVLEDNLRTPSGVSYMLENRELTRRLYPNFFPRSKVYAVSNYPELLYNQLKTLSNNSKPEIVLLTPGQYNSAYYEHTTLARLMGVELVEGRDLIIEDQHVYMKTASGLKKN